MDRDRPLVVLLLPEALEDFEHRTLAEALVATDGVVAVDPPRLSYGRMATWPEALGVLVAQRQAKRLRKHLPGRARAVVIFGPEAYLLARGLIGQEGDCELLYGPFEFDAAAARARLTELHTLAAERAALTFGPDGDGVRERIAVALTPPAPAA